MFIDARGESGSLLEGGMEAASGDGYTSLRNSAENRSTDWRLGATGQPWHETLLVSCSVAPRLHGSFADSHCYCAGRLRRAKAKNSLAPLTE